MQAPSIRSAILISSKHHGGRISRPSARPDARTVQVFTVRSRMLGLLHTHGATGSGRASAMHFSDCPAHYTAYPLTNL